VAFAPVAALALTDVELFPNSPIGLIIKPLSSSSVQNTTQAGGQWVINIGGEPKEKYAFGIQVPINVFIFGIAGGYLRYLYQMAQKARPEKEVTIQGAPAPESPQTKEQEGQKSSQPTSDWQTRGIFFDTLRDIALLFLSPLLAIAVWLVLLQGGTTSILTLGAVSFAIGLITTEVVQMLIRFGASLVARAKGNGKEGT
jgi:hypothetical protein